MKKFVPIIFIFVASLFTVLPLLHNGLFPIHDDTQVVRVFEMQKSLLSGMFPVRWVEDLGYGYGYPIFNFYAPLAYYVGSAFALLGFGLLMSTKIMIAIGVLLSGITMYYFSKKFVGNFAGFTGAILYMYFPYHALNIYVRGAVGELYGYAFLPLVFLGAFNLFEQYQKEKKYGLNLLLVISIFLVGVSHNLTLLMTLLILFSFFVISVFFVKQKKYYTQNFLTGILVGLLLSAFYSVPAFFEMKFTNVSSQIGGGADFRDHFVCINQFWNSMWGYGGSVKGCVDGLSFRLGKSNIIFLLVSLIFLTWNFVKNRKKNNHVLIFFSLILLVFSVFMTIPVSSIVWESISILKFIQYPWRFINFIALFVSLVVAFGVSALCNYIKQTSLKIGIVSLIVLITLIVNAKLFVPQKYVFHNDQYYKNEGYIKWTVSKISDEYMPVDFIKPTSYNLTPKTPIQINNGRINFVRQNSKEISAVYNSNTNTFAKINIAYFPAWQATLNGYVMKLVKTENGTSMPLPRGEGLISLRFEETPLEKFSNAISFLTAAGLLIGIFAKAYMAKRNVL